MSDHVAKETYQDGLPSYAFGVLGKAKKEENQCIVFCRKIAPNVFDIKQGLAVIRGTETNCGDGICIVAPETEVVLVFE